MDQKEASGSIVVVGTVTAGGPWDVAFDAGIEISKDDSVEGRRNGVGVLVQVVEETLIVGEAEALVGGIDSRDACRAH